MVELKRNLVPEYEVNPGSIGIATATLYPDWHPEKAANSISQVRGNLAINFVKEVKSAGYQMVVVDGGSSSEFKSELANLGIQVRPEQQKGMSPGRRQAFREASSLPGVEVVCWSEPEKISFVRDCLPKAAIPILTGTADMVVPKRDEQALSTYQYDQIHAEEKTNRFWNDALRAHHLLPEDTEYFDFCFGPRLFRNTPHVREVFMKAFEFNQRGLALDRIINPELWPDASLLPIVTALHEGLRVVSVTVPYRHPEEQTKIETVMSAPKRKVDIQYKNAVVSLIQYIRFLENNPAKKSRLSPINTE